MPWNAQPVGPRPVLPSLVHQGFTYIEYNRFDHPDILQYVLRLTASVSYAAPPVIGRMGADSSIANGVIPVNGPGTVEATISYLPAKAAKMAAIEILLTDPESLGDDTLESSLYILREKLRAS
jgi:hypothetical protein